MAASASARAASRSKRTYMNSIPTGGKAVHKLVRPVTTQAMAAAARATSIVSIRRRACRTRARPLPGAGGREGPYRLARSAPGSAGGAKPARAWASERAPDSDQAGESEYAGEWGYVRGAEYTGGPA